MCQMLATTQSATGRNADSRAKRVIEEQTSICIFQLKIDKKLKMKQSSFKKT